MMSAVIGILIAIGILIECRYRDIKREIKKIEKVTREEQSNPPQDIVNLNNVWHNAKEEPKGDNWKILCVDDFDLFWVEKRANIIGLYNNWEEYTVIEGVKMWAYIDDLLPKQFRKSEQEKGGEK